MLSYIAPIFLILVLGVALKRNRHLPANFFQSLETFCFYVAFPALMFLSIARIETTSDQLSALVFTTLGPTMLMVLLTVLLLLLFSSNAVPNPSRSSIIQGVVRPSSYFGVAVSALMFPAEIATLVMLALAICLPVVNIVAVVALAWWSGNATNFTVVLQKLATNPIIVSTVAGGMVNVLGIPIPDILASSLQVLGNSALALGLVCVGGGLEFRWGNARPVTLLVTSAAKLALLPALIWMACHLMGASAHVTVAAVFYGALPAAPNAYIMARQMGGDAPLMASIITAQTLLVMCTLPLWHMALQHSAPL